MGKGSGKTFGMGLLTVLAVAMFITMPVGNGFAVSYTAATTSVSNVITVDYFTVGLYTNTAGTSAASQIFANTLSYSGSGPYVFADSSEGALVSQSPLYVKINDYSNTHSTYNLSATWSVSVNAGTISTTPKIDVSLGNNTSNKATQAGVATISGINPETAMELIVRIYDLTVTGTLPSSISLSINLSFTSGNSGSYNTSATVTVGDAITATVEYIEESIVVGGDSSIEYDVTPTDDGVVVQRTDNQSGKQMDVTFSLPTNTKFIIEVYISNGNAALDTTVKVNNVSVATANIKTPSSVTTSYRHFIYSGAPATSTVSGSIRDTNAYFYNHAPNSSLFSDFKTAAGITDSNWLTGNGTITLNFDSSDAGGSNDGKIGRSSQIIIHIKE